MPTAWPKIAPVAVILSACAQPVPHDLQSAGMSAFDESNYILTEHCFFCGQQRVARSSFSYKEGVVITAKITWPDAAPKGGKHDVDWRITQGDRVLKEKHGTETLGAKPAILVSHLSAGSFPPGEYRVALTIDNAPFGEIPIRLTAAPSWNVPADSAIGPDCIRTPKDTVKPIQRKDIIKPIRQAMLEFPEVAADHKLEGCALVAVVLGEDGYPADVKILAEHPDNAGFGNGLAKDAWAVLYPRGHTGEVIFLHANYRIGNNTSQR